MIILPISLVFVLATWQQTLVSGQIQFVKGSPQVRLANGGLVSGSIQFSREGRPFSSFDGIPYATADRFEEAKPLQEPSWEGVLNATNPGPVCPQQAFAGTEFSGEENCLNLNVHVAMNNSGTGSTGHAVMVWIHGGGFMMGAGNKY